jgi:integrase
MDAKLSSIHERYLQCRDEYWHYIRRVPKRFSALDDRNVIRASLKTKSLETARLRRDSMIEADDLYWASLADPEDETVNGQADTIKREIAIRRYRRANARALARGFVYTRAAELVDEVDIRGLIDRMKEVDRQDRGKKSPSERVEAEALLGGVDVPTHTISEAFDVYCDDIAIGEVMNKSPSQKKSWRKTKLRAVTYFLKIVGDKPIADISRGDALKFYDWWKDRIKAKEGENRRGANTANRDLGNLRLLYKEYFKHMGEEERQNPFRNLRFKETSLVETPPFSDAWVREQILIPGVFDGIQEQAKLIAYALIETGCRPSEIANLCKNDIRLDHGAPHIRIRPREGLEIKTASSVRDIPLVGVSLEALRRAPNGFPHYCDKNDLLSASLMKAFRNRGLFPTKAHVIYSFRHSFEKRMLEAGLDYGLRCLLMGHSNNRPAYGDGGSLEYRRDELLKIAHPFPGGLF